MFGCVLSRVVERCGALTDLAMAAKCGVVLKWWSVLDAHKTRAMRVRSTGGVLCYVVAMVEHSENAWGR